MIVCMHHEVLEGGDTGAEECSQSEEVNCTAFKFWEDVLQYVWAVAQKLVWMCVPTRDKTLQGSRLAWFCTSVC